MMDENCIMGLEALPEAVRSCVLTIGNFDGVHVGHQRILARARSLAEAAGATAVAMTFEPPPDLVLRPADPPQRILPAEQKLRLLRAAGAEAVVVARADDALLSMRPAEFIEHVIVRRFAPRHVVEGPNFRFGRRRSGTVETLRQAGPSWGFEVHVAEPVVVDLGGSAETVSSTLVRGLVMAGRVADAATCLGRPFALYGRIVSGLHFGRILEFPTANLSSGEQVCPGDGVYAGRAAIGATTYPAAVSIGTKPTLTDGSEAHRCIEAFLLNAEGDFYDEDMALSFVCRLRDQERFDGIEALRAQIDKDVARVREICG